MNVTLRFVNASIRTPATEAPYKSLNFAVVGPDGKDGKDADGCVIRVTRGAPQPNGTPLHALATTMRGFRVEDGIADTTSGTYCLDAQPVRVNSSKFAGGDGTYVRNSEFNSVTLDAEIAPLVDKTGKAMVSEPRDGVRYAYYKLVKPLSPAKFHVSMFGAVALAPEAVAAPTAGLHDDLA